MNDAPAIGECVVSYVLLRVVVGGPIPDATIGLSAARGLYKRCDYLNDCAVVAEGSLQDVTAGLQLHTALQELPPPAKEKAP